MQFVGLGAVAVLDPVGGDGLHHHETDVVGDDVVQLAGDPGPFLHHGGARVGDLFAFDRRGSFQRLVPDGGARPGEPPSAHAATSSTVSISRVVTRYPAGASSDSVTAAAGMSTATTRVAVRGWTVRR